MGFLKRGLWAMVAVGGLAVPALAQDQGSFDLVIKGLRAGTLTYAAVEQGVTYSVTGQLKTGGLAALLRKVRYDASANGTVQGDVYVPQSYSENANTGKRQSQAVMAYVNGVPQVKSYNPPRPPRDYDVDPASMGGTVDPLTAMYAVLQTVDKGAECGVSVTVFDGRRQSRVTTDGRQPAGDQVVCTGEYRRMAGFSAEDLAEKTRFAFTLIYTPDANGRMQVTEVGMDTLFGRAKLVRN